MRKALRTQARREQRRASGNRYKRAVRRARVKWLTVEHKIQMSLLYWLCGQLNVMYRRRIYNVDHVVPVRSPVVCGLHVPWNMRIMKIKENSRKGNRLDGQPHTRKAIDA